MGGIFLIKVCGSEKNRGESVSTVQNGYSVGQTDLEMSRHTLPLFLFNVSLHFEQGTLRTDRVQNVETHSFQFFSDQHIFIKEIFSHDVCL